ncbi:hypothetical protein MMC13_002004 [Lambiella insularis]|nr:hypothetical protein [Lambiella insularis]
MPPENAKFLGRLKLIHRLAELCAQPVRGAERSHFESSQDTSTIDDFWNEDPLSVVADDSEEDLFNIAFE